MKHQSDYHKRIAWRMATIPSEFSGAHIIPTEYSIQSRIWAIVWPEHPDRTIERKLGKPWPLPPGLDLARLPESDREAYRQLNSWSPTSPHAYALTSMQMYGHDETNPLS